MNGKPSSIERPSTLKAAKAEALEEGTRRLSLDMPAGLHKRLKILAASQEKTVKEYVLRLLEKDLNSHT